MTDFQSLALTPGALDGWWLIGCEESGVVSEEFNLIGVNAISCDLKPSKKRWPHFEGDIRRIMRLHHWRGGIMHPDCTYLTNSSVHHLWSSRPSPSPKNGALFGPQRWAALFEGAAFFNELADLSNFDLGLCLENPVMHKYAAQLIHLPVSQYVQPYQFGHLETKRTGLHLKGLPPLVPTDDVEAAMRALPKKDTHRIHYTGQGKTRAERAEIRSTFYPGIGRAMAQQWGLA